MRRKRLRRTIAAEVALGEELDLLVISVTADRASLAEPAGDRASDAEIDRLLGRAELVCAFVKLMGEGEGRCFH